MRALITMTVGILIGALCAMIVARQLSLVSAYPRGVMAVLQHHVGAAKSELARATRCDPADVRMHLRALQRVTAEVPTALMTPGASADPEVARLSQALTADIARAQALPGAEQCATLIQPMRAIEQACADCHRQYR
jgi:hypothetical protein